jgi:hypothetical protein
MNADAGIDVEPQAAAWLARIDAADARGSWELAGQAFQAATSPEHWSDQLRGARGPLGALTSRALAVEQHLSGLPGAPPGEYVVRQYHSVYGALKAVVETLTLCREAGTWRVVGYFIR